MLKWQEHFSALAFDGWLRQFLLPLLNVLVPTVCINGQLGAAFNLHKEVDMLDLSARVQIPDNEIEFITMRASGAGGQHVNKTDSAVQLRFNYAESPTLPAIYKIALGRMKDNRILESGWIMIRVESHRSQLTNKETAKEALLSLLQLAGKPIKVRRPTKPSKNAQRKRTDSKTQRGKIKSGRGKVKF